MTWHPDTPMHYRNQIVTGDAMELARAIPDESVDLVFTDPPYLRQYLYLYRWLAQEALRVLRPGGYVFAYGGAEHFPAILDLLRVDGLHFFWVDILVHLGAFPRMWQKQLFSGYKPCFVFSKGAPLVLRWRSTVMSDIQSKEYHKWGQGTRKPFQIIDQLTDPGAVIWDPFVGGGTVPAVCKLLHRTYIAFEIDPSTAERARLRVEQAQPSLPGILMEQRELEAA